VIASFPGRSLLHGVSSLVKLVRYDEKAANGSVKTAWNYKPRGRRVVGRTRKRGRVRTEWSRNAAKWA
jgi:hypothetical protein